MLDQASTLRTIANHSDRAFKAPDESDHQPVAIMAWDAASKTATIAITAGSTSANSKWNFNGASQRY